MAPSKETADSTAQVPSTSTFSFKAPFPASSPNLAVPPSIKQRRVSHALPSSPRVVQAWNFRDDTGLDARVPETESMTPAKKGKMRKLTNGMESEPYLEKKQRKKWSDEETQMLVAGCNRHGVGNWKTILSDPTLRFDNRSPVDLKDRFRTYFPDAYKRHYPNARTHLSSKVRSTLPDGSSLFEKTRSKKRRPFTEEEDRALKAGYEKHGTVWATIVKDPVFREQGRRSTDLRDRFRNAFPELYQAAGYKPRNLSKKRQLTDEKALPVRAATDDQLSMSTTGPVRSRRRAHTSQGLFRGGTKSVPQSTACSEDEDSSAGEEDGESVFKTPHTPVFVDNVSTSSSRSKKLLQFPQESFSTTDDDEMDMVTFDQLSSDSLNISDFISNSQSNSQYLNNDIDNHSQTWSGINTPTHSHHTWSTAAGSPTSSHLSADYNMSGSSSHAHSPALQRGMIGNSAWGTQDWFSANPRLGPGHSNTSSSGYPADGALSPASPFSFSNLNHGVLDRYDLVPSLMPHDFSSEVGVGDTHSTFSDEMFPPSGFRGFTHHSSYAGDLIFGARTQHLHTSSSNANLGSGSNSGYVQTAFAGGAGGGANFSAFGTPGLGLSGISQSAGIHPMQLALPGIDEIELTSITLDDSAHEDTGMAQDSPVPSPDLRMDGPHNGTETQHSVEKDADVQEKFSLDDLVDLSAHDTDDDQDLEPHATPPGTPHIQRSRGVGAGVRRASESTFGKYHEAPNGRSISVPPSEARAQLPPHSPHTPVLQPTLTTSPRASTSMRPRLYFGSQDSPASSPADQGGVSDKSVLSSPMPPPRPPPALSAAGTTYLVPSLPPETYTWRPMSPGEMSNMNLPFLDLHYYGGSAGDVGGAGAGTGGGNAEAQVLVRQGQALDLAQASVGGAGAGAGVRQALGGAGCRGGSMQGAANGSVGAGRGGKGVVLGSGGVAGASGSGLGRSQSHHRGQSAVCPQDLVLRNDNKRKRASWDGAHG
ncbi:hypothetical protein H2248_002385 [Termitomyces sp. 'cryptogamus']|nr:hypothetical protein H2248_002385 [Termitomyces sp. 'cryptogamus']